MSHTGHLPREMLFFSDMAGARSQTKSKKENAVRHIAGTRANARGRLSDNPTRERILRVAGSLFLTQGYAATGIDQISKHAGISPPTIYWHFKSKEAMLAEFLSTTVTQLRDAVYPQLKADAPVDQLREYVRAHVVFVLRWYALHEAHEASSGFGPLFGALAPAHRKSIAGLIDDYVKSLHRILDEGVRRGDFAISDISITTMAIVSMADHVFTWFKHSGPATIEQVAAKYADLAAEMVRAR
jgi:TetR/AcrR family transcriptional regulator, cholesterol catabolism regulator